MVSDKQEEVTALDMRLQASDKDLDWKKEVEAALNCCFNSKEINILMFLCGKPI